MYIINQPYESTLGAILKEELSKNYSSFSFMVAYAKLSGVKYMIEPLIEFRNNGGFVKGIVGIDQQNTSSQAVQVLYNLCDELYIYHSNNQAQTFHPKVYYFYSPLELCYSCGSSNFTAGGLYSNFEVNICDHLHKSDSNFNSTIQQLNNIFSIYSSTQDNRCCIRGTKDFIQRLVKYKYLLDETLMHKGFSEHTSSSINNASLLPDESLFSSAAFSLPTNPISTEIVNNLLLDIETEESSICNNHQVNSLHDASNNYSIDNTNLTSDNGLNHLPPIISSSKSISNTPPNIDTYITLYGSYDNFLSKFINESTSYYYIPQGVHLGHIFYLIKSIGDNQQISDYRIQIFFDSTSGNNGTTVRQTKYKVASCMELLLLEDKRTTPLNKFQLKLTNNGVLLYDILNRNIKDPTFYDFTDVNSWRMVHNSPDYYIDFIKQLNANDSVMLFSLFNNLMIFHLLVNFVNKIKLTQGNTNNIVSKIYNDFWIEKDTKDYISKINIETPSATSKEHRIPFLVSLLRAFSII